MKRKEQQVDELILQVALYPSSSNFFKYVCYGNLMRRNQRRETSSRSGRRHYLPFVLVTTSLDTQVQCKTSEDRESVKFTFSRAFELHDDMEVLKRMRMFRSFAPRSSCLIVKLPCWRLSARLAPKCHVLLVRETVPSCVRQVGR